MNWDDRKVPGDMDVWIPSNCKQPFSAPGWVFSRYYSIGKSKTMPMNVKCILEYTNPKYSLKIQILKTRELDPTKIVENFDFDVCKGIMSPALDKDGNVIGVRATHPLVRAAIMRNTATFLERPWDVDENGCPNSKALNRFRKYAAKGYELAVHKDSKFTIEQIRTCIASEDAELAAKNEKPSDKASYEIFDEEEDSFSNLIRKFYMLSPKTSEFHHSFYFPEQGENEYFEMCAAYRNLAELVNPDNTKYMNESQYTQYRYAIYMEEQKRRNLEHAKMFEEMTSAYLTRLYEQ